MCCCRPSASGARLPRVERQGAPPSLRQRTPATTVTPRRLGARLSRSGRHLGPRGMSLIELLTSQVIVAIIAAGMFAVIGGLTRSYHSEYGASEAQVRLREASHVLLRTLQGIGGADGRAGDLVYTTDGGATAPDSLTVFRADFGTCGGVQSVDAVDGVNLRLVQTDLDGDGYVDCPIDHLVGCSATELEGKVVMVEGTSRSAQLLLTNVNTSPCQLTFNSGALQGLLVGAYNAHFGAAATNVNDVFADLSSVQAVRMGSTFTFTVDPHTDRLMRSINGQAPEGILDGVYDLQVVTAHDLPPGDGVIDAGEWNVNGALSGATPDNFYGVRVGLVTYGESRDGIEKELPPSFGNRTLIGAPGGRRYRTSWIFAAARNR